MLLAEKGLPHSANAGYELFDKLGSLGLTSFMQEVTRVRALEGEIARTIQSMRGVKAARVHIVHAGRGLVPPQRSSRPRPPSCCAPRRDADVRLRPGDPPSRRRRRAGPDARPGHGARQRRTAARRRATMRSDARSAGKLDRLEKTVATGNPGQHPQDADALSRHEEFPGQRRGAPQHRQAQINETIFDPGIPGRALGPRRQGKRHHAEHRQPDAGQRRPEPAAGRGSAAATATSRPRRTRGARNSRTTR